MWLSISLTVATNIRCAPTSESLRQQTPHILIPDVRDSRPNQAQVNAQGGSDGGGGNLCYLNGKPVLLEFAEYHLGALGLRPEPGIRFPEDDSNASGKKFLSELQFLKIAPMKMRSGRLGKRIEQILETNRKLSPQFMAFFDYSSSVNFFATPYDTHKLFRADFKDVPLSCQAGNVKASVVYANDLHAFVSIEKWNSLDLDSQAGLFFHENLRAIQHLISRFGSKKVLMTDHDLQLLVKALVYSPQPLDETRYAQTFMKNLPIRLNKSGNNSVCDQTLIQSSEGLKIAELKTKLQNVCETTYFGLHQPSEILSVTNEAIGLLVSQRGILPQDSFNKIHHELNLILSDLGSDDRIIEKTLQILSTPSWRFEIKRNLKLHREPMNTLFDGVTVKSLAYFTSLRRSLTPEEEADFQKAKKRACRFQVALRNLMRNGDSRLISGTNWLDLSDPNSEKCN